jgi:ankyrin repeat protein
MLNIRPDDPLAVAAVEAIRSGDVEALKRLLRDNPSLARARIGNSRTLLHVATDWPGNFPNSAATVVALIASGAEINARSAGGSTGAHPETPLHWAASCDDVAALDALLDHGADIEASGAVIGDGTPLADAVAFGQCQAARRLVERGARTTLWQAAALGLMARIEEHFATDAPPAPEEVTNAFWSACHGGQRSSPEYLLGRGADLNWIGHNELTPLDAATRSGAAELVEWLRNQGAKSAKELR